MIEEYVSGHGEYYIQNLAIIILVFGLTIWILLKRCKGGEKRNEKW